MSTTELGLREELMMLSPHEVINRILMTTIRFDNLTKDRISIDQETVRLATELDILRSFCLHRGYRNESSVYERDRWVNKPRFACAICRRDFRQNPNGEELMPPASG